MNIADLPNCPAWLQEATTHNADVSLDTQGDVTWHGGEFLGGEFQGGEFLGGSFLGGYFRGGSLLGAPLVASASVRSNGHGECGRTLYAIRTTAATYYRCGCFWGSRKDLVAYIVAGDEKYVASRCNALRHVDAMLRL